MENEKSNRTELEIVIENALKSIYAYGVFDGRFNKTDENLEKRSENIKSWEKSIMRYVE